MGHPQARFGSRNAWGPASALLWLSDRCKPLSLRSFLCKTGLTLRARGTVPGCRRAFHTQLNRYSRRGGGGGWKRQRLLQQAGDRAGLDVGLRPQERRAWPHPSVTCKMGDLVQWQEEQRLSTSQSQLQGDPRTRQAPAPLSPPGAAPPARAGGSPGFGAWGWAWEGRQGLRAEPGDCAPSPHSY